MRNDRLLITTLATLLLAAFGSPEPATAQEVDSRWLPWIGCWNATIEEAPDICFRPTSDPLSVEMLTVKDNQVSAVEVLTADGRDHELQRDDCTGWERNEFSPDGRRIYFSGSNTCESGTATNATGIIAMVTPFEWVDVKSVEVDGASAPFVMRYRLAVDARIEAVDVAAITGDRNRAIRNARVRASGPLTTRIVIEASERVDAEAVGAWVAESGQGFGLDGDRLIELADAGVDEEVIDVMVALSYPDEFQIERGPQDQRYAQGNARAERDRYGDRYGRSLYGLSGYGRYFGDPFYYDRFYSSPYGSRFSRFGFGSIRGGFGFHRPTIVVVDRARDEPRGSVDRGRLIRGRGYTRGGSSSGGGSVRSGGSRSTGTAVRSGGSRSGSSRSSSGRKAKRRGGGGGGGLF